MLDTTRQSGIIPNESLRKYGVTVVGVGGIGSAAAECIAKMGVPNLHVYDDDEVDAHNCANQGYFLRDIGYKKVVRIAHRLSEGTGCEVSGFCEKATDKTVFSTPVVVGAVDSMSARSDIWKAVKKSPDVNYYIDGRMGARAGYIFFVDLNDRKSISEYEGTLFPDSEAVDEPCTERATIFCGWGLGSVISSIVSKTIISTEEELKDVPGRVLIDLKHFKML